METLVKTKKHTLTYEVSLHQEGYVIIDEILNGTPERMFKIKCKEEDIQIFWQQHHETEAVFDLKNEPHLVYDYAMLNEEKWEEVQP